MIQTQTELAWKPLQESAGTFRQTKNIRRQMTLDWGQVTPDGTKGNEFLYVYNHDLSSADKIDRTIRFVIGRLRYYEMHLPPNPKHVIKFDIRGQQVPDDIKDILSNGIKTKFERYNDLNIDFIN